MAVDVDTAPPTVGTNGWSFFSPPIEVIVNPVGLTVLLIVVAGVEVVAETGVINVVRTEELAGVVVAAVLANVDGPVVLVNVAVADELVSVEEAPNDPRVNAGLVVAADVVVGTTLVATEVVPIFPRPKVGVAVVPIFPRPKAGRVVFGKEVAVAAAAVVVVAPNNVGAAFAEVAKLVAAVVAAGVAPERLKLKPGADVVASEAGAVDVLPNAENAGAAEEVVGTPKVDKVDCPKIEPGFAVLAVERLLAAGAAGVDCPKIEPGFVVLAVGRLLAAEAAGVDEKSPVLNEGVDKV